MIHGQYHKQGEWDNGAGNRFLWMVVPTKVYGLTPQKSNIFLPVVYFHGNFI